MKYEYGHVGDSRRPPPKLPGQDLESKATSLVSEPERRDAGAPTVLMRARRFERRRRRPPVPRLSMIKA